MYLLSEWDADPHRSHSVSVSTKFFFFFEKTLAPKKINARHKKACQKNLFFYIQVSSPRPVLCKVCTVFTVAHCVLASPTPTSRLPRCSNYLFLTIYSNGDLFLQSVSGMRARNTISRFPPILTKFRQSWPILHFLSLFSAWKKFPLTKIAFGPGKFWDPHFVNPPPNEKQPRPREVLLCLLNCWSVLSHSFAEDMPHLQPPGLRIQPLWPHRPGSECPRAGVQHACNWNGGIAPHNKVISWQGNHGVGSEG